MSTVNQDFREAKFTKQVGQCLAIIKDSQRAYVGIVSIISEDEKSVDQADRKCRLAFRKRKYIIEHLDQFCSHEEI